MIDCSMHRLYLYTVFQFRPDLLGLYFSCFVQNSKVSLPFLSATLHVNFLKELSRIGFPLLLYILPCYHVSIVNFFSFRIALGFLFFLPFGWGCKGRLFICFCKFYFQNFYCLFAVFFNFPLFRFGSAKVQTLFLISKFYFYKFWRTFSFAKPSPAPLKHINLFKNFPRNFFRCRLGCKDRNSGYISKKFFSFFSSP